MGFWNLMIRKDDFVCSAVNAVIRVKSFMSFKEQKLLKAMKRKSPIGRGRSTYIILNGPSVQKQDLTILRDKSVMFVNRGFKHPSYKEIKPEFHIFVDPKMLSGEWPVTWLDEILSLVPDITFVMPVSWAFIDKFQPYIKNGVSFYWLPNADPCTCLGVAGFCFEFAIGQKFETVYFTGFDGNGLAYELVESADSHFYGVNDENLSKTSKNYVVDFYMFSRHFNDLNRFANKCKKQNIQIINLTHGGVIDMFPRMTFSEIL